MRYNLLVDDIEGDGFNVGIFDTMITTAAYVQRAATETAQIDELLRVAKLSWPPDSGTSDTPGSVMQVSRCVLKNCNCK